MTRREPKELAGKEPMTLAEASEIFTEIESRTGDRGPLEQARHELIYLAVKYAQERVAWHLASTEDRRAREQVRVAAHNSLVDACNVLSRQMGAAGMGNEWRARLGDDRRVIGDFACFLHCLLGIRAR
jgi:hypothetical protein